MKKYFDRFCRIEKYVAMIGIVVLTVCIFIGAVARTIGHPVSWTTDIGMLLFSWATFLGGDIAFREGRLANLDLLMAKLHLRLQKVLISIMYLLIMIFLCVIIVYGFKLTYTTRFRTFNGAYWLSYSWATASMPVSACFMVVTAVMRFVTIMKSTDPKANAHL